MQTSILICYFILLLSASNTLDRNNSLNAEALNLI